MSDRPDEDDAPKQSEKFSSSLYTHLRPSSEGETPVAATDAMERNGANDSESTVIEYLRPGETAEPSETDKLERPGNGNIPEAAVLAKAGEEPDKGDLTRAGRAFQKHGDRSKMWDKPKGNPEALNKTGQEKLEDIIHSPDARWQTRHHFRVGNVIEARLPDGRGARWSDNGQKLEGFLDPFDAKKK